jgi:hypothetical protein
LPYITRGVCVGLHDSQNGGVDTIETEAMFFCANHAVGLGVSRPEQVLKCDDTGMHPLIEEERLPDEN